MIMLEKDCGINDDNDYRFNDGTTVAYDTNIIDSLLKDNSPWMVGGGIAMIALGLFKGGKKDSWYLPVGIGMLAIGGYGLISSKKS